MNPLARIRNTYIPPKKTPREELIVVGDPATAEIVFVVEPPKDEDYRNGEVMSEHAWAAFGEVASDAGIPKGTALFISSAPCIPSICKGSEARTNEFLHGYCEAVWEVLDACANKKVIVTFGKYATGQVFKSRVKITEIQGSLQYLPHSPCPIYPTISPSNVVSRPEVKPAFEAQIRMLGVIANNGWDTQILQRTLQGRVYEWVTDLQPLIDEKPKGICFDTETAKERDQGYGTPKGALQWYHKPNTLKIIDHQLVEIGNAAAVPLVATISYKPEHAFIIPLDCDYYPNLTPETRLRLIEQLRTLLEDPEIAKTGHNLGFDMRIMHTNFGIDLKNWFCDTLQTTFALDENMQKKALDEGVARWLPHATGYSKEFESKVDYDRMREVPHDLMCPYASGDTDFGRELAVKHLKLLMEDKRNYDTYKYIQMPALQAFEHVTRIGMKIDTEKLASLWDECILEEKRLFQHLLQLTPSEIIREKLATRKKTQLTDEDVFNFKSPLLLRDILFSPLPRGYGLIPVQFTESTLELDEEFQLASTSTKKHLPYFEECPFVPVLEEYIKLKHMMSGFIGQPQRIERRALRRGAEGRVGKNKRVVTEDGVNYVEEVMPASGIWKHLDREGWVHPSFHLSRVITGRTSCSEPNIQQVPKRGPLAKKYRSIYVSDTPDGAIVAGDLSQIELRLSAEASGDPTMMGIYMSGGDIHAATGAEVKGVDMTTFLGLEALAPDEFEHGRYLAKAVNFGFIYGAWWTTFRTYAKTQFKIDVSEADAKTFRERFFNKFYMLPEWHEKTKEFAHRFGYVRSMHGALRRLPSINSTDKITRQEAERQAVNSPIQRLGSDMNVLSLLRFHRDCPKDRVRIGGAVHDQIILYVRNKEDVPEMCSALKFYMESNPLKELFNLELQVPILADIEAGDDMGSLKKKKETISTPPSWYRDDLDRNKKMTLASAA